MKQTKLNLFLIITTIVVLLVSLILSKKFKDPTLFGRSGSIITLLGVIMEYRRIMSIDKENKYTHGTTVSLGQTRQLFNVSPKDKKYRLISNIIVILGTIIWGYGDLFI